MFRLHEMPVSVPGVNMLCADFPKLSEKYMSSDSKTHEFMMCLGRKVLIKAFKICFIYFFPVTVVLFCIENVTLLSLS